MGNVTYPVVLSWNTDNESVGWNIVCSQIIERFGMPGDRYSTEIGSKNLIFYFQDAEDALVAQLVIGDHSENNF